MRIETIYYADDGTEFYDEEECRAYEESINAAFDGVVFFNEDVCRLNAVFEEIESDAMYMFIKDAKKADRLFCWMYEQISFGCPDVELHDGDFLMYDLDSEKWINMGEKARFLMDGMERMRGQL